MNQIEKIIDIATWNRKEHFEHFSAFDDPFFGVTVHVDCTRSYQEAKDKGVSFSLLLLHRIITAASKVEEFRYRIEGDKVVCYDSLLPEATVGRADHTFSFHCKHQRHQQHNDPFFHLHTFPHEAMRFSLFFIPPPCSCTEQIQI